MPTQKRIDRNTHPSHTMPAGESPKRLKLPYYHLIDPLPEPEFDQLAQLAAQICQTPMAMISFVDHNRQWTKAVVGWQVPEHYQECSFCVDTVQQTDLWMIADLSAEPRFITHPLVAGEPHLRFYAGAPLISPKGIIVGVLCVLDTVARSLTADQQSALQMLSQQVIAQLELRRKTAELKVAVQDRNKLKTDQELFFNLFPDLLCLIKPNGYFKRISPSWETALGYSKAELLAQPVIDFIHTSDRPLTLAQLQTLKTGKHHVSFDARWRCKDGSYRWLSWHATALPKRDWLQATVREVPGQQQADVQPHIQLHINTHLAGQDLAQLNVAMGEILAAGSDLSQMLEASAAVIARSLNLPFLRIWTLEPRTHLLELQAIAGQHRHTDTFHSRIPVGIGIIGIIAQNRQPYITDDAVKAGCVGDSSWLQDEKLVGFAGYPLLVDDRLVGVMALFSHQSLSDDILKTLSWLAPSMAVAIDRLWARATLRSRREALLFRLASQIRDSLNLDIILNTTVTEIRTLLKIDRCHFLWCWMNGDRPDLVITHEDRNPDLPSFLGDCPIAQVGVLSEKILSQAMIRVNDVHHQADLEPAIETLLIESGIVSQLLVPLENHSGQLGAIVCSHGAAYDWSDREVELLNAVADQVAIAIDQAELYAKTRTAAIAAEAQAKQLSDALHHLQQTQTQLIQTEKMSSLGQMVAGIAHEINNPVNFINGNLVHAHAYINDLLDLIATYQTHYPVPVAEVQDRIDAIDLEFIADDLPKLLDSMRIGGERIHQIVLSLRNFSRLDEAEMKPVDIHEGIDSTLLILHNRLKTGVEWSGIQVNREFNTLPLVECYPGQLNQVFMNILSNAIDAIADQPDPRTITIQTQFVPNHLILATELFSPTAENQTSATVRSGTAGTILIRIRDNGPGMPDEVLARLFDPFFTTKPVGKGTGLGLSICYQIVQKHRGSLDCISAPGKGTEFIIRIPAYQNE